MGSWSVSEIQASVSGVIKRLHSSFNSVENTALIKIIYFVVTVTRSALRERRVETKKQA